MSSLLNQAWNGVAGWRTGSQMAADYRDARDGGAVSQTPDLWTHDRWLQEYGRRLDAYTGIPYRDGEVRSMSLFQALDAGNNVIQTARRLSHDYAFVCDTDAAGASLPSLEVAARVRAVDPDVAAELQELGEAVWRRSRLGVHWSRYVQRAAVMGDLHLEAVRYRDGSRIVGYDPRCVEVEYDDAGVSILRAVVTVSMYDGPDELGTRPRDRAAHTYRRVLTPERIEVYKDGKLDPEASGPHGLGVVPLVHAPWLPYVEPDHGSGSGFGLDAPLALVDSLLSQMQAIGTRHANPILLGKGFRFADDSKVFRLGNTMAIPEGADASYIEASLQGITALLDAVNVQMSNIRATFPQFMFTESGANASGEALSYRASQWESHIRDIRGRVYGALAEVTERCRCLDAGVAYSDALQPYRCVGGAILPRSVRAELEVVNLAVSSGLMRRGDAVARLQSLGLLDPQTDPAEYAAQVQTESAEIDAAAVDRLRSLAEAGLIDPAAVTAPRAG